MSESSESLSRPVEPEGPRGLLRRSGQGGWRRVVWPATLLVVGAVVGGGWWLTNSPLFHARHIEISGQAHLSRIDILRLAGIDGDTNVFWFHGGAVAGRLEENPWIANASVSRSLPQTIRIEITERTPVAELKDVAGFLLVASDGTVLDRSQADPGLPVLSTDVTASSTENLGPPAWVVSKMSPWLRARVRSVVPQPDGSLVIHLTSGVPAYYGPPTDVLAKARALAAVLRWALAGDKPLESINVRAPIAPTALLDIPEPAPVVVISPSPTPSPSTSATPSPSPQAPAKKARTVRTKQKAR